ncbi:MAG TPA: RNA polymerase sigma factor [Bacteroidales bacterium]|nr:RNA polymerase sigma factor [Bacteroidales bacterium]HPB57060.1 RNA polymerase sigma factor [Bacteroidales bacterium]
MQTAGTFTAVLRQKGEVKATKTDQELIEGCLNNDRVSQHELYHRYASKMFVVCLRYAKTHEDAEDILVEGFLKVFTNLVHFKGKSSLRTWIHTVMVNSAISYYRKHKKHIETRFLEDYPTTEVQSIYFSESDKISEKELLALIQAIPEPYKTVFNLYAFEGYSYEQIAEMLDIHIGTARSRMSKGKAWLQDKLKYTN